MVLLTLNRAKLFHVKHFGAILEAEYSRPHTTRGLETSGIGRNFGTLGGLMVRPCAAAALDPESQTRLSWPHESGTRHTLSSGRLERLRPRIRQPPDRCSEVAPIPRSAGQDQDLHGVRRLAQSELHPFEAPVVRIDQGIV